MKAIVVYESLWGNTATVARAIAEGIGHGARAVPTDEATHDAVADADLVVAGAPVLGFRLATEEMRENVARSERDAPTPPDLAHPSLRTWLEALPLARGPVRSAAYETRIWWSPRGATGDIERAFGRAGYPPVASEKFIVRDKYGPLRDGEVERARVWGASLATLVERQRRSLT